MPTTIMSIYLNLHLINIALKVVNIYHMQHHLAAANSVGHINKIRKSRR